MRTTITFFALLISVSIYAQDKSYLHTSTVDNTSGYITYLDHPDLNGNPNADIFFSHNYSPGNVFLDAPTGTWYDGANWTIFTEDISDLPEGVAFNVYIADGGTVVEHSQDGTSYTTTISESSINGDAEAVLISAKYWNPNGVYNLLNYGFWYDDGLELWNLYAEDLGNQPANAAYKVLVSPGSGGAEAYVHTATVDNISNNWTVLDNPTLNGNPDVQIIVQHNWGTSGDAANIVLDKVIGVWYTGTNWAIYNEDISAMDVDLEFNVYIAPEVLAIGDVDTVEVSMLPNPTKGEITISASQEIQSLALYNMLGQKVQELDTNNLSANLDMSHLPVGQYLVEIKTLNSSETKKIIKN